MPRKFWKWVLGISIALLILLILFTVFIWMLANVSGILFYMLSMGNAPVQIGGISFGEFMSNFVGSPIFFVYLADIIALVTAAIMLRKKQTEI